MATAHKGGNGAALQALKIERMGQICFNKMSIRAMPG